MTKSNDSEKVKSFENDIQEKKIILRLKKYIQPFERILAKEEVKALVHNTDESHLFDEQALDEIAISTSVPFSFLQRRLAYWERIGIEDLYPTLQVIYEEPGDDLFSYDGDDLLRNTAHVPPKKRKLRYGPHDIHEYRGKFFPQLVKSLINISGVKEGAVVLDPFCGSGTTNCEARIAGMHTLGLDLNPLSVKIATIKSAILDVPSEELNEATECLISNLSINTDVVLETQWDERDLKYLKNWFAHEALIEIVRILQLIDTFNSPVIKSLFELCLSNIIRIVSWQKESDLRVRKEVTEYLPGTTTNLFAQEVQRQVQRLIPYLKIVEKQANLLSFDIKEGDTKNITEIFPDNIGKCDVLITSPPYATALPYLDTDRLSLIILGLLPRKEHRPRDFSMIGNREITEKQRRELWGMYEERKEELPVSVTNFIDELAIHNHKESVGFRRRNLPTLLAKYFLDMSDSMKSSLAMMKPGSYAFYVVGNNSTKVDGVKIEIPTEKFLWEIGEKTGWIKQKMINMELLPSRDIFKNNRGTSESILVFKAKG